MRIYNEIYSQLSVKDIDFQNGENSFYLSHFNYGLETKPF